MRRFQACVFVLLGAGLLLAPAQALASMGAGRAAPAAKGAAAAGVDFKRLGATSTYTVSGVVRDYAGNPVQSAYVFWGWWSSMSDYRSGGDNLTSTTPDGTLSDGVFKIPGVSGGHQVSGNPADDLFVSYNPTGPGLESMESEQLDFAANNDSTSYHYDMQPAHVNVAIGHAPAPPVEVVAGDGQVGYAKADVSPVSGLYTASVLPMASFDDVVAFVYSAAGGSTAQTESVGLSPVAVAAGTTAADTVDLDWDNAQHAYLAGPLCRHSGKPGTTVTMTLKGWPTGETASFVGYYGSRQDAYPQTQTSGGAGDTYTVPLQINTKAPVDLYQIGTYRLDDPHSLISLQDYFQVCTFKSSTSWLHRGKALRLSGAVPVPGSGYVAIYSTSHKVSGQPLTLAAKGWVRGTRYRVSSSGKFLTGALYPTRTTWYVAKYTGTDFPAFTSVIKVNVH